MKSSRNKATGLYILCTCYNLNRFSFTNIYRADEKVVGIGVLFYCYKLTNNYIFDFIGRIFKAFYLGTCKCKLV